MLQPMSNNKYLKSALFQTIVAVSLFLNIVLIAIYVQLNFGKDPHNIRETILMCPIAPYAHCRCPPSRSSRYWLYLLKVFTEHRSMILHMNMFTMCPICISQKRFQQDDKIVKNMSNVKKSNTWATVGIYKKRLCGVHTY